MKELFEGKQLIFLEKDYKCPNSDVCIESAKFFLEDFLDLSKGQIDSMIVKYQYNQMDRQDLEKVLYNPTNVIVTHSVYVQGSDTLFQRHMASTGRNDIKGLTYVDTSGMLVEYLNRSLRDIEKEVFNIVSAINTNNIISIDYKQNRIINSFRKPQLLKIDIKGLNEDCVVMKELNQDNIIPPDEKLFNRVRVRN